MCTPTKDDVKRKPAAAPSPAPSLLARAAIAVVLLYRYTFSALLGRQCRYQPTCSEYALDALRLHGFWPGSLMTLARICRCGPFGGHGFDPVPPTLRAEARWFLPWRYGVWRTPREDDKLDPGNQTK
jgi:uncharacterized protein